MDAEELARRASDLLSDVVVRVNSSVASLLTQLDQLPQGERLFYLNPAGSPSLSPKLLEVDTMILGLSLLTVAHATLHRHLLLLICYLVLGIALEQLAIRVLGTHCHGEALLMVSQCSSASSLAMYVPALYSCQVGFATIAHAPHPPRAPSSSRAARTTGAADAVPTALALPRGTACAPGAASGAP